MQELAKKLWGVQKWKWNADRFIVFQKVIIQRASHVSGAQAIWQRIAKCLDSWEADQHHMLLGETARTCEQCLYTYFRDKYDEKRVRTYHSLVLRGKLRMTVR